MTPWTLVAGWTLVHFVWQGAAIAALAAAMLWLLGDAEPRIRYAVCCLALAALLAAPVATAVMLSGDPPMRRTPESALLQRHVTIVGRVPGSTGIVILRSVESEAAAIAGSPIDPWLPGVLAVWFVGVCLLLARLGAGWWRIRELHRAASAAAPSRWAAVGARVAAALSLPRVVWFVDWDASDTPMVIGYVRPIVLLPVAALAQLTPAQVEMILAHELAHVRRHDFLVNLLQATAETLLFYHPAVWWISRRIRIEREHCCDDVAVAACGDAVDYAAALSSIEARRAPLRARTLAVAATDGSLVERVRRLLGDTTAHDPRGLRAAAGFGGLVVLTGIILGGGSLVTARSMPPAPRLEKRREVMVRARMAIREKSDGGSSLVFRQPGGFTVANMTVRQLLRFAYQPLTTEGGPSWIDSERFTFDEPAVRTGELAAWEVPTLLQHVVADRFGLVTHREPRQVPAYALTLARADGSLGPNLKRSQTPCVSPPVPIPCGDVEGGLLGTKMRGVNMARIVDTLERSIGMQDGRPVVDRTGLAGTFDLDLDYVAVVQAFAVDHPQLAALVGITPKSDLLVQQLGLKLEPITTLQDVIVVDGARSLNEVRRAEHK